MLQRSPTYIRSLPSRDPIALGMRKVLPGKASYAVTRLKNITQASSLYTISQKQPKLVRKVIRRLTMKQLPQDYPVDVHFKPTYGPWDQRLCLVPNGDLFRAIRKGRAEVVTDTIETFTEKGLRLGSGSEHEADIIINPTRLKLTILGAAQLSAAGETRRA